MWWENGTELAIPTNGCMASEFDQYGDLEAFGVHPDWQRQLTKFASVQDRLREWKPEVMAKLTTFSCMAIKALDIDAIRIDKSTQVTLDALAQWTSTTRACAAALGKTNFFITGEVTGGNTFGSLYIGRGRTPEQLPPPNLTAVAQMTPDQPFFLRDAPLNGLDGIAFHYSTYRSLTRFLGMDGNLQVADRIAGLQQGIMRGHRICDKSAEQRRMERQVARPAMLPRASRRMQLLAEHPCPFCRRYRDEQIPSGRAERG